MQGGGAGKRHGQIMACVTYYGMCGAQEGKSQTGFCCCIKQNNISFLSQLSPSCVKTLP